MTYSGNPSLSADAQQRILGTFEQTLDLAEQGSRQEALLGCDFVLRMDPQFEPARRLLERLKATTGAVAVGDLKAAAPATGNGPDELYSGSLHDLPDLPDLHDRSHEFPELPPEPAGPAASTAHTVATDSGDLHARLLALLTARRFQDVMTLVESESAAVMADPELGKLAQAAYERSEAEPYVTKFLGKVRETIAAGQLDEAAKLLDKARSLDATHPGIAELAGLLARQAPAPAMPPASIAPPSSPAAAPPAPTAQAPAAPPSRELPPALRPAVAPAMDLLQTASAGDSESERRISQLLNDGQAALDAGDPQAAIDAWSRIFLIDIDHQEAARR
ncbi:MAG TPA: hypothetical protein VOA87_01020, partial [Thermoanaerobaculia bacterium]|nr:hypothetical protein [Thermoanaerobaculia bacterium]